MRSAISSTMLRSWVAVTMVLPAWRCSRMKSISQDWLRGSSPAVGSSISHTCGFRLSTEAIATRFFSPPDRRCGRALAQFLDAQGLQGLSHALGDLLRLDTQLQRGEGHLLPHRGREKLHVAVLKHQAHPAAEIEIEASSAKACSSSGWPKAQTSP